MTRSLNLVASMSLLLTGTTGALAHDGHSHSMTARSAGCGCSDSGSSAYPSTGNGYYSSSPCGSGGCSPRYPSRDRYDQLYQPQSRYEPRLPQVRRAPSIPRGMEGVAKLSVADQYAALQQRTCPVTRQPLGSMGTPMRISVMGQSVFVCCEGCVNRLKSDPQKYLAKTTTPTRSFDVNRDDFSHSPRLPQRRQPATQIPREMEGVALLPASERELALHQRTCPVTKQPLGSMGKPIRVNVAGRSVFVCCEGCVNRLKNAPQQYLSTQRIPVSYIR